MLDKNFNSNQNSDLGLPPKSPKKLILWVVIGIVLIIAVCIIYFFIIQKSTDVNSDVVNRQTAELDALRKEVGTKPFTEEETKTQTIELDKVKGQTSSGTVTQEEINKQTEDLDKLKGQ